MVWLFIHQRYFNLFVIDVIEIFACISVHAHVHIHVIVVVVVAVDAVDAKLCNFAVKFLVVIVGGITFHLWLCDVKEWLIIVEIETLLTDRCRVIVGIVGRPDRRLCY